MYVRVKELAKLYDFNRVLNFEIHVDTCWSIINSKLYVNIYSYHVDLVFRKDYPIRCYLVNFIVMYVICVFVFVYLLSLLFLCVCMCIICFFLSLFLLS